MPGGHGPGKIAAEPGGTRGRIWIIRSHMRQPEIGAWRRDLAGARDPPGFRVSGAAHGVCVREADPLGMTRPDPVRALPQADWDPPVVADPDPPDDPQRGMAPAGNP